MTGPPSTFDPARLLEEEDFVRRLARGLLFDDHRVDDVVQQTWLAALGSPPRGGHRLSLRAWLSTVVRRTVADTLREEARRARRERHAASAEGEAPPSAADVLAREEQRRAVVDQLAALSEPYRTAVALRYLEGLEPAAIARRLGVPAATVRTRVRRGLEQMRAGLDQRHGGDRRAWALALIPLAQPRGFAAAAGMATPWMTIPPLLVMKTLLCTAAAILLAALVYNVWPEGAAPPQTRTAMADTGAGAAERTGASDPGAQDPARRSAPAAAAAASTAAAVPVDLDLGGLRGRLLDPFGDPLPGAVLRVVAIDGPRLFAPDDSARGLVTATARTDADGRFAVTDLPRDADCALVADADGDLRQLVPLPGSITPGVTTDLGDIALAALGVITGTVLDADGSPRAGVEVLAATVPAMMLGALAAQHTDPAEGVLVALPAPTGAHLLDPAEHTRQLRRALARLGVDAISAVDAARHRVTWLDGTSLAPLWELLPVARTQTGDDGRFRLGGVSDGANVVVARAPGRDVAMLPRVDVAAGAVVDAGELQLERGELGQGLVVDAGGEPVAGAEVRVAPIGLLGFRGVAPCLPAVRTDARGLFEIAGLPRGRVLVAARRGPGAPWFASGPLGTGDDLDVELPESSPLELRVTLPDGVDPADVVVCARPTPPLGELLRIGMVAPAGPLDGVTSRVDSDVLRLRTPPLAHHTTWTLTVAAPGCRPAQLCAELPDHAPEAVTLEPTAPLQVRVRDVHGAPCPDALVSVQDRRRRDAARVLPSDYGLRQWRHTLPAATQRTGADGVVRCDDVPTGALLWARRAGAGAGFLRLTAEQRAAGVPVELRLGGTGAIEGRVTIGGDGPYRAATLRVVAELSDGHAHGSPPAEFAAAVDPDGSFHFADLPVGSYRLELRPAPPRAPTLAEFVAHVERQTAVFASDRALDEREVTLSPGSTARAEFTIGGADRRLGRVRGQVFVDGAPATGMEILRRDRRPLGDTGHWLDSFWEGTVRARVDDAGGFEVVDLPAGRHWLGLRDPQQDRFLHVWEVDVPPAGVEHVAARLRLGVCVGRVLDDAGWPVAGLELQFQPCNAEGELPVVSWVALAETDADGRFRTEPVTAGHYVVRGHAERVWVPSTRVTVVPGERPLEVELVGKPRHAVHLRLAPAVALPADGLLTVRLRAVDGGDTRTHASPGRACVIHVGAPGRYEIRVSRGGTWYHAVPAQVQVEGTRTEIEIDVGARFQER